jgi:hypothetical protein
VSREWPIVIGARPTPSFVSVALRRFATRGWVERLSLTFRSLLCRLRNMDLSGMPTMITRGRKPRGVPPMTASERQHLERERNRRAREAVNALSSFATNAWDWEEQRPLSEVEILNTIYLLSRWAIEGTTVVDWWRLTYSPDARARVAKIFDRRLNIQLPFCSTCGNDMRQDETGKWRRCECVSSQKSGAKQHAHHQ